MTFDDLKIIQVEASQVVGLDSIDGGRDISFEGCTPPKNQRFALNYLYHHFAIFDGTKQVSEVNNTQSGYKPRVHPSDSIVAFQDLVRAERKLN